MGNIYCALLAILGCIVISVLTLLAGIGIANKYQLGEVAGRLVIVGPWVAVTVGLQIFVGIPIFKAMMIELGF